MSETQRDTCPICCKTGCRYSRKRGWRISYCNDCDHYYVTPLPTDADLAKAYSSQQGYGKGRETDLSRTSARSGKKLDALLTPLVGGNRSLLDVGCGDGRLIYNMRRLGWIVAGTDYSDTYVETAKAHDLEVHLGDLAQAAFNDRSFGAAVLGDVVEHLTDPRLLLETVRSHLGVGGVLVIQTPNAGSGFSRLSGAIARVTGTDWLASEAPLHLNDFTQRSLTKLVYEAGFDTLSCKSNGRRAFSYTIGASGYLDGLKRRLKRSRKMQKVLMLTSASPLIFLVAAWTAVPFFIGRLSDVIRGTGDYLSLVAKVRRM